MKNLSLSPRVHSPPLDNPKRPFHGTGMDEEFDPNEKFQKVRKIDSPTENNNKGSAFQFPSPQYINVPISNKSSPKPEKRSSSPKAMYPPSIQKFLNGKAPLTIDQAVDKLKSPSPKTFKNQLEKMKLLGRFQEQEIETSIGLRKAYSNSPNSVSPARSASPIGSPMVLVSPRHEEGTKFRNSDNIVMTFDDDNNSNMMMNSPQPSVFSDAKAETHSNVPSWMPNTMTQSNNFHYQQGQQQPFNSSAYNQQVATNLRNIQISQGSQPKGFNQKNISPRFSQDGYQQSMSPGSDSPREEIRERTTSFLLTDALPGQSTLGAIQKNNGINGTGGYKSLADSQLSAIQSIMQAKRTISPGEPNKGLIQYFHKRNSNPENNMRNITQQKPLYQAQNNIINQEIMQNFNSSLATTNQQYVHSNNNNTQFQNMFPTNPQSHLLLPPNSNVNVQQQQFSPYDLEQKLHETALNQQTGYRYTNTNIGHSQEHVNAEVGYPTNNNIPEQITWNLQEQFDLMHHNFERDSRDIGLLDPGTFLLFDKNEPKDFDMNVIPSDVNFIPQRNVLGDMFDDQFVMPEFDIRDGLNLDTNSMFRPNNV